MMRRVHLVSVALGMLLLAACGTSGSNQPATHDGAVDVLVLRTAHYNYVVFESLEDMVAEEPVAVTGVVSGFAPGHTVLSWNSDVDYHDVREPHVVMRVEVDEAFKGAEYVLDGSAYVSISRGAEVITASGEPDREPGAPSTVRTVAEFEAAISAGTRVALLVDPRTMRERPGETWTGTHDGYPMGATMLGSHPQGLIFEDRNGASLGGYVDLHTEQPGWQDLATFDSVVQRLRTAQFSTG